MSESETRSLAARQRWHRLSKALLGQKNRPVSDPDPRRFTSYGLFLCQPCLGRRQDNPYWHLYTSPEPELSRFRLCIRHAPCRFDAAELSGFDNTGNVQIWPSEEVLAYYCATNPGLFKQKSVLELGGGMTCLAGLTVALCAEPRLVTLTDGNHRSVENVQEILTDNTFGCDIETFVLDWSGERISDQYDVIISADCLFFERGRSNLLKCLYERLKWDGMAIVVAPRRNKSFQGFVTSAMKLFEGCEWSGRYSERVWNLHEQLKGNLNYKEDEHYPWMLTLTKKRM